MKNPYSQMLLREPLKIKGLDIFLNGTQVDTFSESMLFIQKKCLNTQEEKCANNQCYTDLCYKCDTILM